MTEQNVEEILRQVWPQWSCVCTLGGGTYGDVFRIRCEDGEEAALKVITVPHARDDEDLLENDSLFARRTLEDYESIVSDCENEIRLLSELRDNPYVVQLQDSAVQRHTDKIGWTILIRMELLTPLRHLLPLAEEDVMRLGVDICEALHLCAQKSILHRDIKPGNIFRDAQGRYKLGDFGISRVLDSMNEGMTQNRGTPLYIAPEAALSGCYDYRADLYSLGLVLYMLLNGERMPFLPSDKRILSYRERQEAHERRMRGEELPPPAAASEPMAAILAKACAFRPEDRFADAAEMKAALLAQAVGKSLVLQEPWKKVLLAAICGALVFGSVTAAALHLRTAAGIEETGESSPPADAEIVLPAANKDAVTQAEPTVPADKAAVLELLAAPDVRSYMVGDTVETEGLRLRAVYGDGREEIVTEGFALSTDVITESGQQSILVYYGGKFVSFEIKASLLVVTSIKVQQPPYKTEYYVGDTLSAEGLWLMAMHNDGTSRLITSGFECVPQVLDTPGTQTVTVTYSGQTTSFTVTVKEALTFKQTTDGTGYAVVGAVKELREITIPAEYNGLPVTVIAQEAFRRQTMLREVTLPETLQRIEESAFAQCWQLRGVHIPASVEYIDPMAFDYCSNLMELSVAEGNAVYHSVDNCIIDTAAKTLLQGSAGSVIPGDGSVTIIGERAFIGVEQMSEMPIPDTVTEIREFAFNYCSRLETLHIPASVERVGRGVTAFSVNLVSITADEANPTFFAAGNCLIERESGTLVMGCPQSVIPQDGRVKSIAVSAFHGLKIKEVPAIPASVTNIQTMAFATNEITEFVWPETVTWMENAVLYNNMYLREVTIPAGVRAIPNGFFKGCTSLETVYYGGTRSQWEQVSHGMDNEPLENAAVICSDDGD